MGNYLWRRMNHKLANDMKMWKGNWNTTKLLFSLKKLQILQQERRGQVKTILMEYLNSILFHKSGPDNNQHTNQSITQVKTNLFSYLFFSVFKFSLMLMNIQICMNTRNYRGSTRRWFVTFVHISEFSGDYFTNFHMLVGLSGLGVTWSPRDPIFARWNPAEVDGFFQDVLREGH